MSNILVSVLMSVYNGETYVREALDSLLSQTWENWECIVINDGSTDKTAEILDAYSRHDSRFRVFHNETNLRLPASLNRGLSEARGRYIVRFDADDVCGRNRIERQVWYMENHPELSVSACKPLFFDGSVAFPGSAGQRTDAESTRALFLFFNPICHSAVIAKAEIMKKYRYDASYSCTEDLELWLRMLADGERIAIQDEYLLLYRIHGGQTTKVHSDEQRKQYRRIIRKFYSRVLCPLSEEESRFMETCVYYRDYVDYRKWRDFAVGLRDRNQEQGYTAPKQLSYACFEVVNAFRDKESAVSWGYEIISCGLSLVFAELIRRKKKSRADHTKAVSAAQEFKVVLQG